MGKHSKKFPSSNLIHHSRYLEINLGWGVVTDFEIGINQIFRKIQKQSNTININIKLSRNYKSEYIDN